MTASFDVMNPVLRALIDHGGGVITRADASSVVPIWTLDAACRTGELLRVLPEVYVDAQLVNPDAQQITPGTISRMRAWGGAKAKGGSGAQTRGSGAAEAVAGTGAGAVAGTGAGAVAGAGAGAAVRAGAGGGRVDWLARLDPAVRYRAVTAYADGRGAFSHTTALAIWGVRTQDTGEPVHLSVPARLGMRSRPGLVVHQRRDLVVAPPQVLVRRCFPVTRLESALVDSWPVLPSGERREPVIRAVNKWLTTPQRIRQALADVPKLTGRAELRELLRLLEIGCRSHLEIWGHEHVFTGPGMPAWQRQVRIRVNGRTFYLDLYTERERVNIELDGAASHGGPGQREIDLRRDALLASVGILVVRFSHDQLVREPDAVRRRTLAILAARRTAA